MIIIYPISYDEIKKNDLKRENYFQPSPVRRLALKSIIL